MTRKDQAIATPAGEWDVYSQRAHALARSYDFSQEDLRLSRVTTETFAGPLHLKSISWFIPDFHHAFFGGIHTILRFADHLAQQHGISNRFVLVGEMDTKDIAQQIAGAFPNLHGSPVHRSNSPSDFADVEDTDAAIATFWITAYHVLKFNRVKRKFYFIQDFEALFYPAGSTYAQIEATYRFGLYGITNTRPLREMYESSYGGKAQEFVPSVDTDVFHPLPRSDKKARRQYTVFFYGRPQHPRNGFELGTRALGLLKGNLGSAVHIYSAGAIWEPAEYGLGGIIENLGLLPYTATAELYRTCDVGLAMMFTGHPSYVPFELMASGCLVVANRNPSTTWLLRDGVNCLLAEASATDLSDVIEDALYDERRRQRLVDSAHATIHSAHNDWGSEIDGIYRYMCDPASAQIERG